MDRHGMKEHGVEEHAMEGHGAGDHGMDKHGLEEQEGDILDAARIGDADAVERLLNRYKPLVRTRAHSFHLAGADREDLVQEGMIGLFKAIRDFQPGMGAPFSAFADLCVTRQLMTAVKSAARKKHLPLNSYLSFSQTGIPGKEGESLPQLRESEAREPERRLIHLEDARRITLVMENGLSLFEKQVIGLYMAGIQYQEIALRTKRTAKAIDNALQRIRRKIGARLRADKSAE